MGETEVAIKINIMKVSYVYYITDIASFGSAGHDEINILQTPHHSFQGIKQNLDCHGKSSTVYVKPNSERLHL